MKTLPQSVVLSVALFAWAPPVAVAQTPTAGAPAQTVLLGTPEFARLIQGKKVRITTLEGKRVDGVFAVVPAGLLVGPTARAGRQTPGTMVPFDQIARVERVSSPHRGLRNGLLIGLGVGGGLALLGESLCEGECRGSVLLAASGAGVGAGIGALVDALSRTDNVIYDAGRRTTTMALSPILSPKRKGLTFSITWR
jgi:hypothetical protein